MSTEQRRYDISGSLGFSPADVVARLWMSHSVDVVVDVGANAGQYGGELRTAGYAGRIASFEPLRAPYAELSATAAADPMWDAYRIALGDVTGAVVLHVAANGGASSSILRMLDAHIAAAPWARYIGTEDAEMRTLDSIAPEILNPGDRAFLKADVQGYERWVLAGAASTLRDHCIGVQLEMSLVPLYEGAMSYRDAIDVAEGLGFALMGLVPVLHDPVSGRLLQMDGVFVREEALPG